MELVKTGAIVFCAITALGVLSGIYLEGLEIRSRLLALREDILRLEHNLFKQEREKADGQE